MKLSVNQFYNYQQNYECGGCTASLKVSLHDSLGVVCAKCGTFHSIENNQLHDGEYRVVTIIENTYSSLYIPTIPLGTSLKLKNDVYTVSGVINKKDGSNNYWHEYFLHSEAKGYLFLSEYQGHWIILRELEKREHPEIEKYLSLIHFEGKNFTLYQKYLAEVYDAVGEFPIDLNLIPKYSVREYIAPPLMLTVEYLETFKEGDWFLGENLDKEELSEGLGGKIRLASKVGVGQIEPYTFYIPTTQVILISLVGVLISFVLLMVMPKTGQVIFEKSFTMADSTFKYHLKDGMNMANPYTTTSFELKNGNKNLEFYLQAEIQNEWLEVETTLVNETTGEEYSLPLGIEYYSGVDGGESWTEGSKEAEEVLEKIPAGKYHLEITPMSSSNRSGFYLKIKRDVRLWGSFIFVAMLLAMYPLVQFFFERYLEKSRWMDSDYSEDDYSFEDD